MKANNQPWRVMALVIATATLLGCATQPSTTLTAADTAPEAASARTTQQLVHGQRQMFATANPLATQAGYAMLEQGGSAIDAIIAAQAMLTLVEPQSSGIGGGAFLLHYDGAEAQLQSYDGRETAPALAMPDRFLQQGQPLSYTQAVNSGLSVGTPGVLRALEMAHQQYGRLPWATLFEPAIQLATEGFSVSPRLHTLITDNQQALREQPAAAAYFLDAQGQPWPVGHRLKNLALADTLTRIAQDGVQTFYEGEIAEDMVSSVRNHPKPGDLSLADLQSYVAVERAPLCGPYRRYTVCGMPPPSSGGLTVLQLLGVLQQFPMQHFAPQSVEAVHYFSEAGRLAYADRDFYVADPAYVGIPVKGLLSPAYLRQRSALIQPDSSMGKAEPGDPMALLASLGKDHAYELPSTSHLVAADAFGNLVTMTTSVEAAFGSKILVRGFLLNNQLTDFSSLPTDAQGRPVANRVEAGKRPRSSMAPVMVFEAGEPYLITGSPGGSAIINYVAQTLVGVLDWGLDIQAAIALPHYGSRNGATELEEGTAVVDVADALRAKGHNVNVLPFTSGLQGIVITKNGLYGGADPRREGLVLAD
ncbi:gamma-glutamyltransferase [Paenalcaligenes sp. Me131]|uniref:gamma-glutamyltransferase n=1 Tax=Paenalcaligenes sp. Me131 TaxID=3392636 RepID=UPI003D271204